MNTQPSLNGCFLFFFFFGGEGRIRVWTQSLALVRQVFYYLSHASDQRVLNELISEMSLHISEVSCYIQAMYVTILGLAEWLMCWSDCLARVRSWVLPSIKKFFLIDSWLPSPWKSCQWLKTWFEWHVFTYFFQRTVKDF
jgi:hypothetical protein